MRRQTLVSERRLLEEGFALESLHRILLSMEQAGKTAGVTIIAGDTKVVNRGCCDKIFITTSGLGAVPEGVEISAAHIRPGDKIILSGTIADHGMAIVTSRENLSFQTRIQSDSAALNSLVDNMLAVSKEIHAFRDPTRGGLAATLNEFAKSSEVGIEIDEDRIPVSRDVRGACEVLGIDPLYAANEGKLVAAVPGAVADEILPP